MLYIRLDFYSVCYWLFQFELTLLSEIDSDFEGFGISAIELRTELRTQKFIQHKI